MKEVYLAHSTHDKPFPALTFPGQVPPLPYSELSVQEGVFPIAENTTLPQDYYERLDLDARFPRDRDRADILTSTKEEGLPQDVIRTLGSTAIEALEPWQKDISPDHLVSLYSISDREDFYTLSELFLKAPSELRDLAYTDPATMPDILEIIGDMRHIREVASIDAIVPLLEDALSNTSGKERINQLEHAKAEIEKQLIKQRHYEDTIIDSGSTEGARLQDTRINRKRFVADGIDASLFRFAINNGTIVNPAYLHNPTHYQALEDEPEVSFDEKLSFLRHMMAGHWALGQDHTFVYRNAGENMAAAQTGVKPDYAAIRPGNFLYHDLKLLEHGPYLEDFPLDVLFEYVRNHYLRQMDLTVLDEDRKVVPGTDTLNTSFIQNNQRYIVPFTQRNDHIIPFRALKKDEKTSQYYEYGEECYMAELVDIALQLDEIERKRGTFELQGKIGYTEVGPHAAVLIHDLMRTTDNQAAALAIEQLLFMDRQLPVGGRQAIVSSLTNNNEFHAVLDSLATEEEPGASVRPPLTGYYEWFLRHARAVDTTELKQRGIPIA